MQKWIVWLIAALILTPLARAQTTVQPIVNPYQTFVDGSGNPCAGCSLYSYAAGSTTPQPTYTDSTGTVQNANPIVLDASGGAFIWIGSSAYRFVLEGTDGTVLWTVDNVKSAMPGDAGPYLPLTGGTLSGNLTAPTLTTTTFRAVLDATQYSGSDACAKINAAVSALPPTGGVVDARGFGATMQTVSTTCNSSSTPSGTQRVRLIFSPATVFEPASASTNLLNVEPNTEVTGFSANTSGVSYTGNAVQFVDIGQGANYGQDTRFSDFNLFGAQGQGNGILIQPSSLGFTFLSVYNGTIHEFGNGLYLHAANGFINGNTFTNIDITQPTICLNLDGTSETDIVNGNVFTNVSCEGNGVSSVTGINLAYAGDNIFQGVNTWDYTGSGAVNLAADTHSGGNKWTGLGSDYLTGIPENQSSVIQNEWITSNGGSGNPSFYSFSGFQLMSGTTNTAPTPTQRGISTNAYTGSGGNGGAFDFWIASNYLDSAFNFFDSKTSTTNPLLSLTSTAATYSVPVTLSTVKSAASLATDANGTIIAAPGVSQYLVSHSTCAPATSTDSSCTGTISFATSFADAGYGVWTQVSDTGGAFLFMTVTGKSAGSFNYALTCTFNCATVGSPTVDVYAYHP